MNAQDLQNKIDDLTVTIDYWQNHLEELIIQRAELEQDLINLS